MAALIPEETLAEIRSRVSLVAVIGDYVALRKAGRNHLGLCPFHGENTPSFSVNEEGGFFHCFGCGASGNVFTFLTRFDGISFPEAVRRLAVKAGVELPQAAKDPQARQRARLYQLNNLAAGYFQRCLRGDVGVIARRYVAERGLNQDVAERFHLGYAPSSGQGLTRFLTTQHADLEQAATLGLIGKRESGGYYDKFRHRLMFPITDIIGRVVGFGGRLLPIAQESHTSSGYSMPKYLNSADSVLYKKGVSLYGLFQAKDAIQQRGRALVVEGYIDLLSLVQQGYSETVAVLGTALGLEQLALLRRVTNAGEVYMFFDGDEAGQRAATRAFPLCVEAALQGKSVFLPPGFDPDTFVRQRGQSALDALVAQAEPLEDFYFRRHAPPPGASALQRAQAARQAMTVLESMNDVVARGALLTQIAQRFGVSEEELRQVATGLSTKSFDTRFAASQRQPPPNALVTAESELLQLMCVDRHAALRVANEDILSAFQHWAELATEIISAWRSTASQNAIDLSPFLERLPKALADRVSKAYTHDVSADEAREREQLLLDCLAKIRTAQGKQERAHLRRELQEAERRGDEDALRVRLHRLQEKHEHRHKEE